jgi:hypothetical protein
VFASQIWVIEAELGNRCADRQTDGW